MSEEQTIQQPSELAVAKAHELSHYIGVEVNCIEPQNKEPKRNGRDTGYWQTMANLRVKIFNKQTGIILFPEFNALMGNFTPDNREPVIIVNCDNSMQINNTDRNFIKTHPSDELHALIYVEAIESYAKKGFVQMSAQSEVAQLTGRAPSEIMDLTRQCIAKAQTYVSAPSYQSNTGNIKETIANDEEDNLPM